MPQTKDEQIAALRRRIDDHTTKAEDLLARCSESGSHPSEVLAHRAQAHTALAAVFQRELEVLTFVPPEIRVSPMAAAPYGGPR